MMDTASAELCKYAANSILATRISFMNEIANVCELLGADVDHVRKAIGSDRRIGTSFLFPGVGYGGSCFPKDVRRCCVAATRATTSRSCARSKTSTTRRSAARRQDRAHFGDCRRTIAVWGLAFKPRTDDMREAPAIPIIERLLARRHGAGLRSGRGAGGARIFDGRIALCEKSYEALAGADALAIVTEWNEFREPDFRKMRSLMKAPVVFDGRNIYSPEHMRALGFTYFSIGR
jgi:UDPglucose 6-dehydrogenase